jgi:hypothetical protein
VVKGVGREALPASRVAMNEKTTRLQALLESLAQRHRLPRQASVPIHLVK